MEQEQGVLVSPTVEVPVIEGEVVTAIRTLAGRGVGKKAIAREIGVAVNTVRRYLRQPIGAGMQVRPSARRLTEERRQEARALYEGPAGGNAVVVQRVYPHLPVGMDDLAVVEYQAHMNDAALGIVEESQVTGLGLGGKVHLLAM